MRRLNDQHKLRIFFASTLVALSLVFLIKLFVGKPRLDSLAERYAKALYEGDMQFISEFVPTYELNKLGMSRLQVRQVLDELVLPKFAGVRYLGTESRHVQGNGVSGIVFYRVALPSGITLTMSVDLQQSDDGPIRLLSRVLRDAWIIDYRNNKPHTSERNLGTTSTIEGIARDRVALEHRGFIGFVGDSEESEVTTFEEQIDKSRKSWSNPTRIEMKLNDDCIWETQTFK